MLEYYAVENFEQIIANNHVANAMSFANIIRVHNARIRVINVRVVGSVIFASTIECSRNRGNGITGIEQSYPDVHQSHHRP